MFLLMLIGLFTSRVVLRTLGVDDYGTYNVVGGVVTVFTFLTTSISAAISRFLAVGLGGGDSVRLRRIFSTGVLIQLGLSLLLVLLVETAGVWWLNNRMDIPAERMDAARWVLQCAMGVLVVNLLAVPYNAAIIAHERMSAFAVISIGEAVLKLTVALLLYFSSYDKLITYAVLMVGVAFEFPTVIWLLSKLGVLTRDQLYKGRRYAVVAVAFIAAIVTPADPLSMVIVAAPLYLLYEIAILLCSKSPEKPEADASAA